ncbi:MULTISPECIES: ribonuclease E inhibitor RraB [Gammaproteobacteria]|uniref:ribonuclease E inhibitor RraB n=1 Tax=Gammaproteobacteria TaxID=1236 RepID=UPI000DD09E5D|nr:MULTISPECIES: ribonuclease E inhibitor RraB [Gammaproteobacteria]RTE87686.1 ribonuclease E inhibitor RraB [Aliidiomarina sp. B3213]TCZ92530.1 ribonuclease E inhibitor RraB [Lysobacter sp. N42]
MNSLEDLLEEGRETIDAMVEDGLDPAEIYDIEHHVVSPNFDKLEKAAVDLVKAGFQVDDAEEFENEDGKVWYYFAAVIESELSHAKLEEQTKAVYEITSKAGVEYDGWGTYLGEDEELDEDE